MMLVVNRPIFGPQNTYACTYVVVLVLDVNRSVLSAQRSPHSFCLDWDALTRMRSLSLLVPDTFKKSFSCSRITGEKSF